MLLPVQTHMRSTCYGGYKRPVCQALVWCCYQVWMLLCASTEYLSGEPCPAMSFYRIQYVVSWGCPSTANLLPPSSVYVFMEVMGKDYMTLYRCLAYLAGVLKGWSGFDHTLPTNSAIIWIRLHIYASHLNFSSSVIFLFFRVHATYLVF